MFTGQLILQLPTVAAKRAGLGRLALSLAAVAVLAGAEPVVVAALVAIVMGAWDRRRGGGLDASAWLSHLCEMVVAMYAGMLVYHGLLAPTADALFGAGALAGGLRYAGMVTSMVLPMAALMRIQGHGWQMTCEMTAAMVAPGVGCFALVGLGLCPLVPFLAWLTPTSVYAAAHDGMLLGMLVLMVIRRQMYGSGPTGHGHERLAVMAAA